MSAHEKSWWREIAVGVAIAVISAVTIARLGLDRSNAPAADPLLPRPGSAFTAASGPAPPAVGISSKLVGTWLAEVVEHGVPKQIVYHMRADGASEYTITEAGYPAIQTYGSWQYSDGVLFERFSNGATGKGAIRWIDNDHFEVTILDNGVPAFTGLKRHYYRQ